MSALKEKIDFDPNNTSLWFEYANHLYNSKDYKILEKYFSVSLKKTYNIKLWKLYIEYVKKAISMKNKDCSLVDVYEFALNRFENHWDAYSLFAEYISELNKMEDDQNKIEKIRSAYNRAFLAPMKNMNKLWRDYENFELELNKSVGKKLISDALVVFQNTFKLYQILKQEKNDHTFDSIFRIIDIENKNLMNLNDKLYVNRMKFIYNCYLDQYYYKDEIYFLFSEFLIKINEIDEAKEVIKRGIKINKSSLFILFYYGTISN